MIVCSPRSDIDDNAITSSEVGADTEPDVPQLLEHEIPIDIRLLNEQGEFLGSNEA